MDELLQTPQRRPRTAHPRHPVGDKLLGAAEKAAVGADVLKKQGGTRLRALSLWLSRNPISPLVYLTLAAVLGVAGILSILYVPSYVVNVGGTDIGVVSDVEMYEQAVASVEKRASRLLGYSYTLDEEVTFTPALTQRDEFTTQSQLEEGLFDQIGEVMEGYVLTVGGVKVGAADNRESLAAVLEQVAAPYRNENTVDYGFVDTVSIELEYISSRTETDPAAMLAALTANTVGETTYTVVRGDTYSGIASANDITLDQLMELNPQASMNSLMIGDVLTVKQEVPFLSVYTVDNLTYEQAIEIPVEYVDDSSMYIGQTRTVTKGKEGVAEVNADVTCVNGYETERTVISTTTVTEPTATVIARGTTERPKTASTGTYIWPCSGQVTSRYGYRSIFGSYSFHSGIDIANSYGTRIVASDGGKVTYAGWMSGYGYLVIITHDNGEQTYYGHNSSLSVSVGQRVYQGQTIARMGSTGRSTGNHCHFEVRVNGAAKNPCNYL